MIRNHTRREGAYVRIALRFARRRNTPAAVFGEHGDSAAEEIPEVIREVAVRALDDGLRSEVAVLSEHHFAQQVVAQKL